MDVVEFSLEVNQNRYLPADGREMHAVRSVTGRRTADGDGQPSRPGPPRLAEVLVIDCSGSMADPPTKIAAAVRATSAAIDVLPDGVRFAVVEGTERARVVYPPGAGLGIASAASRKQAKAVVARLSAGGGTAMGSWLAAARDLLPDEPSAICHTLLLTDGINQHETPQELDRVLGTCVGRFVCDARGIGDGWRPRDLVRIATALSGTAEAVRRPAELEAGFRATIRAALAKLQPDVRIRVRTVPYGRVGFFKQVRPAIMDLTDHADRIDDRTVEFTTGSWGAERREFHLRLDVTPPDGILDEDRLAAQIDLVVEGKSRPATAAVLVNWTEDLVKSARLDPGVSQVTGQEEVRQAINAGCDAYDRGDRIEAHAQWTRAVELATKAKDEGALEQLRYLVQIDPGGLVRLKPNLSRTDVIVSSVMSSRTWFDDPPPVPQQHQPTEADRLCGQCGWSSPPDAVYCEQCGAELDATGAAGRVGT
ncbi:Ca-activated chloride channel family protein [Micromonospora nigra]|uniref:Ca-activated chloride channel family protein n=1 Tax=Micromonospora nigra TaxID=145857 RepID=A0A1C6SS68_9ACTN|nr:VWA domain-containing protein [Micromonospora nigra]SCL32300.1 Ca-activated chloride channel family protein [Micromonospora nigra]